eukprot:s758_g21.t2
MLEASITMKITSRVKCSKSPRAVPIQLSAGFRIAMADRKAVIKNADMAEDMQQDAIDSATQALEKYNIEKDIAAFIKKAYQWAELPWSSIRSTTPPGTVWWVATLVPTSRTRRSISSISIWGRWQFYSSSRVEARPCQKTASLRQSAVAARRCDRSRG